MIDLKAVLTIASFLFCAQAVSQTGLLNAIAELLQSRIQVGNMLVHGMNKTRKFILHTINNNNSNCSTTLRYPLVTPYTRTNI